MSKINAMRFINLNYNNNSIKINDEIFYMNGESTLLSLRNGGGKSVLVQMMMAPFVHKRYRDAKDRPFESYFTTGKPTFIMVEWQLDQGAGYALTGMMVRRSQSTEGEQSENLDMINFVSEYQEPCLTDIHSLPVVEKGKKEMVLKNFVFCRQLFEGFKKDSSLRFFYYDMANSAQSRQYFDKLMEYQINYKEWETIIKKVNLEESGLSNLFADCRDERGLVEKWFLEAVEGKLNREKDRMREFQAIIGKYVGQYKDNQSKIQRRDTIRLFKEEGVQIEEKALQYQDVEDKKRQQEGRIACFIRSLNLVKDAAQEKMQGIRGNLQEIRQSIEHIEYERLSGEYYELEEKQKYHIMNRDMFAMEQDELERERQEEERQLHVLLCAKQQSVVKLERADLEEIRQKVSVFHKQDEDLVPERIFLGYGLRRHYETLLGENAAAQEKRADEVQRTNRDILERKEKIEALEQEIRENAAKEGALKSSVKSYDVQEERYNARYGESLSRNIMGAYEPGMLEIKKEVYRKEGEDAARQQGRRKKQAEDSKERVRSLERSLEEQRKALQQKEWEKGQKEKLHQDFEEELSVRSAIMKYLDMGGEDHFDTEKILHVSERKLREIAKLRRDLEKEEDALQREYQKLTQGKTLELPEQLERELTELGIHIVYGMEWLKKNGYSEQRNREIVHSHPFLPYALILSGREIEKLSGHAGDIYTSFPIPIIRREELESKQARVSGSVVSFSDVSFYVLFNENLLDEKKLEALVEETMQQIQRKKEAIIIRDTEYKEYFERKETVRNQTVSKARYEENTEQIEELKGKMEECTEKVQSTSEELAETKEEIIRLEAEIREAAKEIEHRERQIEDFELLCSAYTAYEQDYEELGQCRKQMETLMERKHLSGSQLEKLQERLKKAEFERENLLQEEKVLQECFRCYADYESEPSGDMQESLDDFSGLAALSIAEKEARFKAITSSLSQELRELEGQEQKALKRYQDAKKELDRICTKFKLEDGAWLGSEYNAKKETYLEEKLESLRGKIECKKMLSHKEETQIEVLRNLMQGKLQQIRAEFGREELLPKQEIQDRDFDAVKNQLVFQENQLQKQEASCLESLQSYDENLTALAEYSDFAVDEEAEWEEDIAEWSRDQLRRQKGSLVRDYRELTERRRDAKDRLVHILNGVIRKEVFAEDFYRKPLEAMLELAEDASQVLQQLNTTVQSYENLMEKLEVDISVIEKEKEKIIELMEDYIRDVQINLGKIDANSTITVRERPLKMLKIQLPEWDENVGVYHLRLIDFIDEITQKGVALFEQNENAQEFFGTQVTTKNLYDTVVGIGNVQIKLYKIEEQREYPITWAEVARNSGGEGFLSAFVILSSLLYYMRKDDTDFFADRNEGKVLVMDNPFAQTNASHLLKPLMDMAKKANTQLICLTGLGGESIYNRFDNIYVLNLIAASLRNGMQYLKVDRVKGNEPETMVISQIEVVEQMELTF
ncbi:MAG: hypothetical protein HFH72_04420 [Lachnospiraceae bacterium]|nr:hypothetical protein [Lachnospiraceae bacterium]